MFDLIWLIVWPIVIIVIAIAAGFCYKYFSEGITDYRDSLTPGSELYFSINQSSQPMVDNSDKFASYWDFIILILVFGYWIILLISAAILGNNPVFLVIYVISSVAAIVVGIGVKVALNSIVTNSLFTWLTDNLPMTVAFINLYVIVSIVFIVTIGVVTYMKLGGGQPSQ